MQTESAHTADAAASRAFARFCARGDADALGEVFDLTAPRLAVLAGHLVPGDAHAVEDLVQTTFLEAIRCAPSFTPGRRVLPWLVRILARRAANLRRQRGRRRERGGAELQEIADASLDPARLVADRELAAQVAAAVEALEAPYREVLALRLVHGLSPVEIARALDRPLGTVHAQLHRGGERLRRALPRLAALCFAATPELAAVRARVLAAAREATLAAPASAGLFALGGLLVTKKILAAAVLIALVLAGALAWFAPPARTGIAPSEALAPELAATADAPDAPAREEDLHRVALPRGATDSEAAGARITLRARVIAEETGAPLAGCEVAALRIDEPVDPPDDATPDATTATDADGRFQLRLALAPTERASVTVRSPGRVPMCAWLERLRPGVVIDSGDVPMMRGVALRLRVRDEHGEPVQGFAIQLRERRLSSTDRRFSPLSWGGNRMTDAQGIAGPCPVPAGDARIEYAEGTGHVLRGPMLVHVPDDRAELLVDLTVHEPDPATTIAGVVTDERGAPLVGVDVAAQPLGVNGTIVSSSFGGGRFFLCFRPGAKPATIVRVGSGSGANALDYEVVAPREPVTFGTRGVRVIARRVPKTDVTVRVVRAEDRTAVESLRAAVVPVAHRGNGTELGRFGSIGSLRLRAAEHHAGGVLRLASLPPVDHLVVVVPDDPTLAPVVFHELRPDPRGDATFEIPVPDAVSWSVRVTDARGEPIAGSRVALVQGVGRTRVTPDGYTLSWEAVFERGVGGTQLAVEIAVATTDAAGIATLRSQPSVAGCGLRVRGARHLDSFTSLQGDVASDEVRNVVVTPAARVRVQLEPPEVVAALGPTPWQRAEAATLVGGEAKLTESAGIRVWLRALGAEGNDEVRAARAGDDGRCALEAVPPGDYAVLVRGLPVAEIRALQPGEERALTVDVRRCAPTRIQGRVLLDGLPPPGVASVALSRERWSTSVELDPDGRFARSVDPGEYRACLQVREDPDTAYAFELAAPIVVPAGAELDLALAFTRRRVDFQVTGRDGAGCARTWIALHREAADDAPGARVALVQLDADGRGSLQASWNHPLRAVLWLELPRGDERAPRRTIPLGRVEVPPGRTANSYEFTVDRDSAHR